VQVALAVGNGNATAVGRWRGDTAVAELVLLPQAGTGIAVEGVHRTLVVGDEHLVAVDGQAGGSVTLIEAR
jgi:hypothetical protein